MKWTKVFLAGAIAFAAGACNGGTPTPTDTGTGQEGGDAAMESGTPCDDAGNIPSTADAGACYRVTRCDHQDFCPAMVTNNPMTPAFAITQIDIVTPVTLATGTPVWTALNQAIASGTFFWGMNLDFTANTIQTGALDPATATPGLGTGYLTSSFVYLMNTAPPEADGGGVDRFNPVMASVTLTGESFSTAMIPLITIPVFNAMAAWDGGPPTLAAELPLHNAIMHDVQMNTNRNCIGYGKYQFSSCLAGRWDTTTGGEAGTSSGVLEGDLLVDDAKNIPITALMGMPLCNVLSMSDCTMGDPSTWHVPPDRAINGSATPNAWHLLANFSAVSATITH